MNLKLNLAALMAALAMSATHAQAPKPPPSAVDSDPVRMGWMVGSPPAADKLVRFADMTHYRFPQTRWSFANFRQLAPTSNISRGDGSPAVLPRAERGDIDAVTFVPMGRTESMTWAQSLDANYTDAIVVLHKGRIVYERYFGVMKPPDQQDDSARPGRGSRHEPPRCDDEAP